MSVLTRFVELTNYMRRIVTPLVFVLLLASPASAQVITNLVGYWSLEEASGTAADAHGSNPLSDATSTTGTTGKVGNGRTFVQASSQQLTHADNSDLSTGADQAFSWAFWIKLASNPGTSQWSILAKIQNGGAFPIDYQVRYDFDNSRVRFGLTGSGGDVTLNGTVALSTDGSTWAFVVVKHDPVADKLYVSVNDQATPDELAHSLGTTDTTGQLAFGSDAVGTGFIDGMLDEVGFWKKALTAAEITWLYNGGSGRSYADIVAQAGGSKRLLLQGVGTYEVSNGGSGTSRLRLQTMCGAALPVAAPVALGFIGWRVQRRRRTL